MPQLQGLLAVETQRAVGKVVGAALLIESAEQIVLVGRRLDSAGPGSPVCGSLKGPPLAALFGTSFYSLLS